MYILGISCFYHDSSACLLRNGQIVAAVAEERFTKIKHDNSFPINAIKYCLEEAKISIQEIDYIGFYEKPFLKFERVLSQHLEMYPKSFIAFYQSLPSWLKEKLKVPQLIKNRLGFKKGIFFIPHHLAHAASSFLVSPFQKAAILTLDGVGEWATTACGYGERNKVVLTKEIQFPHSIGLLYSTITAYLGFKVNNDEYKVMGLAAYGNPDVYYQKLKRVIDIKKDGSYKLEMAYFTYHYRDRMPSEKLCKLLGGPTRRPNEQLNKRHKDIAASLQKLTEEVVFKILNNLYRETGCQNLCLAGGVALNSVANGKIIKKTSFKKVYIPPDPGDGGTSLGAAFYIYNSILDRKRNYRLNSAYLGPHFTISEVEEFLKRNEIKYSSFKDETDLIRKTAKLIYENKIVAWFQGRMEWGPRALGARSILANPCNPKMKDIINKKVKHREPFRPFAPAVLDKYVDEYFEVDKPLPVPTDFMLMVYPVKKEKQKLIPAVVHVDGTARPQVIKKEQNPRYYRLIEEFSKLSGVPILLNTSLNVGGEPIVCTPKDAYHCIMGTQIDCLVIDRFLVKRKDNLKILTVNQ